MSERYLDHAAVVLACGDSPDSIAAAVSQIRARTHAPLIIVRTKADISVPDDGPVDLVSLRHEMEPAPAMVDVSAETGTGLRTLLTLIEGVLSAGHHELPVDAPVLTRARHRRSIDEARAELRSFRDAWSVDALPAPVAATHLRNATVALEELIGVVDVEDVLDRVFSTFCVGK
jgi:tRNA modification GTPase